MSAVAHTYPSTRDILRVTQTADSMSLFDGKASQVVCVILNADAKNVGGAYNVCVSDSLDVQKVLYIFWG